MAAGTGQKESVSMSFLGGGLERVYPPWPRSFGRTACGRADGEECNRRRGGRRFLKYRHGHKCEDLQEPSCTKLGI